MAGNSTRRGAVRTPGSKKGASVGTGGKNRRALEGRGPTPPATERTGHPAARRANAAARREEDGGRPGAESRTGGGPRGSGGLRSSGGPRSSGAPRSTGGPRGASGGQRGPRAGSGAGRDGGERRSSAPQRTRRPTRPAKASSEAVAGRNSVVEALRADVPASALYVATRIDTDDRVREALRAATQRGLPVLETTKGDLDRLADGAVHQGLVLQVPPYAHASLDDLLTAAVESGTPALVVALDGVTDPRNLGAVVRSVAAFGGHGVLVPERRSAGMTASAWKTSAGAAARVPVARETNLTRALEAAQAAGCFVIGLDADADAELSSAQVAAVADGPVVLVVGSEGNGLSRLVRATCDLVASIPMAGPVESLNAGVAAGVALYEVARVRAQGAAG